ELFAEEPELAELAQRVREARPEAPLAPHFQAYLRARLMDAAGPALEPKPPLLRRLFGQRTGPGLALVAAPVGAAVSVYGGGSATRSSSRNQEILAVRADVQGNTRVGTDQAIHIDFSQAMDHDSVVRAIRIEPATRFTTSWQGNTLTITPTNH